MIQAHDSSPHDETTEDPAILLAWLEKTALWHCADCGISLCGHNRLRSRALIGMNTVRCLTCMAHRTKCDPTELDSRLNDYICRRECYAAAWLSIEAKACGHLPPSKAMPPNVASVHVSTTEWDSATEQWDAGDLGCGDLVLPLRGKLRALAPGTRLHLQATDPAAPIDLAAWCRLTGHELVACAPPHYLIQRRTGD